MAKEPKKEKKFKKGDIVFWIASVNNITRKFIGEVIFVINPHQPVKNVVKKMNKYMTNFGIIDMYVDDAERPETSYVVTIKDKDGKDVLHWPRSRKLSLVSP